MNKKLIYTAVIVIVLLVIIIGISKNSTPKESIKIGAALMLTGPTAHLGELQKNAIDLAIEKINKDGGINGRSVEVVVEDSTYDPKQAVSAYQSLKTKGLRNFIIDGSSVIASTHQLVIDDGNFSIAGVATAPSYFDGSNHTCRIAATSKTLAPGLSKQAIKDGYKKVAMLMPNNEYGKGFADEFTKSFTASGGVVVVTEFYNSVSGASDARTNITKIKSAQGSIDAIIFSQIFSDIEATLKQMKTLGINKPILSEFPTITNPLLTDLSLVEGVKFVDSEYVKTDSPKDSEETRSFKEAYRTKYSSDPIFFSAAHYDITLLLAKAIGQVGEDPQKISDYVSSLKNYNGVTGIYSFDNDCEVDRTIVTRKVEDGKIVDVE